MSELPDESRATRGGGSGRCVECGTELAPAILLCPQCGRLVHSERLAELHALAQAAEEAGQLTEALTERRTMVELLPRGSKQHAAIVAKIEQLAVDVRKPGAQSPDRAKKESTEASRSKLAGLGVIGLAIWKLKFIVGFAATKAKFLLLGLSKASTFFSMLLSVGAYWALLGWQFALGLVLSIYVHEMGHVSSLRRYGIHASAPMFIPGLGAMIRLKQGLPDVGTDARVGLAGPWWGLGAALASYGLSFAFDSPMLVAIAKVGAWINVFNLMPIWQLDGGRAFRALDRRQSWLAAGALGGAWFFSTEGLLFLIAIVAAFRAVTTPKHQKGDRGVLISYVILVAALTALASIPVPGMTGK